MLTERTRVRRRAGRGSHDTELIHSILDAALTCHVGFVVDGQPYVIPTLHARLEEHLYLHGAPANRMLGVLATGARFCVTATIIDGLVLARSAFHHSVNYRSVVVLGTACPVTDVGEQRRALRALVERVQPGRSDACRPPTDAELGVTAILRMPIVEASAKVRSGPPIDDVEDLSLPHWAGVIPLVTSAGVPEPDPVLRGEIAFPHARRG